MYYQSVNIYINSGRRNLTWVATSGVGKVLKMSEGSFTEPGYAFVAQAFRTALCRILCWASSLTA
jgi:hypothetical protein